MLENVECIAMVNLNSNLQHMVGSKIFLGDEIGGVVLEVGGFTDQLLQQSDESKGKKKRKR